MPRSPTVRRSEADWEAIIDRYLASGLSQRAFCEREGISRFSFGPRYHKSPKFAGLRRVRNNAATNGDSASFAPVRMRASSACVSAALTAVTIRLEGGVAIECPLSVGAETIVRIAREVARR